MLTRLAALWLWLLVPGSITVALGGPAGLLPHAVFHSRIAATMPRSPGSLVACCGLWPRKTAFRDQ